MREARLRNISLALASYGRTDVTTTSPQLSSLLRDNKRGIIKR